MFYYFVFLFIKICFLKKSKIGIVTLSSKKISKMIERKYTGHKFFINDEFLDIYLKKYSSFIDVNYLKWLQMAKLETIPIDINLSIEKIYK